jgi:hypothetical protein
MENFNEKKEYANLTPEQNKTLQEINDLLNIDETRGDNTEKFFARQLAARDFQIMLRSEDIEPLDYILWHRAIGSTPPHDIAEFDTEDKRIEKFIRDFDKKYEEDKKETV